MLKTHIYKLLFNITHLQHNQLINLDTVMNHDVHLNSIHPHCCLCDVSPVLSPISYKCKNPIKALFTHIICQDIGFV